MLPVTAENMNYCGPVVGGVMILALIDWFTAGRKRWQGPAGRYIEEDEDEYLSDDGRSDDRNGHIHAA